MSMLPGKPVFFRDNRQLSQPEYQRAVKITEKLTRWISDRESYIQKNNLDPNFCYPGGFWGTDQSVARSRGLSTPIHGPLSQIIPLNYEAANVLRFFTYSFTGFFAGYNIAAMGPGAGPPVGTIPTDEDLEQILRPVVTEKGWKWLSGPNYLSVKEITQSLTDARDAWFSRWVKAISLLPYEYIFSSPKFLGEVGWDYRGTVINAETYMYQERINLLYESGIFDWLKKRIAEQGHVNILEIGGGYGALAWMVKRIIPNSTIWICDLPECVAFSTLYLALTRPDCPIGMAEKAPFGFSFFPNYMFDEIQEPFDLVLNTLSFTEMAEYQFRYYAQAISRLLDRGGLLYEQNMNNLRGGGTYSPNVLKDYFAHSIHLDPITLPDLIKGEARVWSPTPINLIKPMIDIHLPLNSLRSPPSGGA